MITFASKVVFGNNSFSFTGPIVAILDLELAISTALLTIDHDRKKVVNDCRLWSGLHLAAGAIRVNHPGFIRRLATHPFSELLHPPLQLSLTFTIS